MNLNTLFDRPIAFHRCFVTITGSVTAALMLSQAFYWSKRTSLPDGWFYKSQAEWHEETGLTRREQETARKVLRNLGIFSEKLIGIPATLHYKINQDVLSDLLKNLPEKEQKTQSNIDAIKYGANVQTGMAQTSILDDTKRTNWNGANEHTITENTNRDYTETTTDIKTRAKAQSQPKNNPLDLLLKAGVSEELAIEFIQLRKNKRALITPTVINGIAKEADKAGITISEAITHCIVKNWQSFNASWYVNTNQKPQPQLSFKEQDRIREQERQKEMLRAIQDRNFTNEDINNSNIIEGVFSR